MGYLINFYLPFSLQINGEIAGQAIQRLLIRSSLLLEFSLKIAVTER